MKLNVTLASLLLIALISSIIFTSSTRGVTYSPGVSAGNWGYFTTAGNSTFKDVTHLNITITQVMGNNVTTERTAFFNNGSSPLKQIGWINIESGETGTTSPSAYGFNFTLIAENLNRGDIIYSGQPFLVTSTGYATVANANRTVNTLELGMNRYAYWDQATGFLVGFNITTTNSYLTGYIQQTNIWSPPKSTPIEPLQLLAALLLPTAIMVRHSSKKTNR